MQVPLLHIELELVITKHHLQETCHELSRGARSIVVRCLAVSDPSTKILRKECRTEAPSAVPANVSRQEHEIAQGARSAYVQLSYAAGWVATA